MKTFAKLVSIAGAHHPMGHTDRPASPAGLRKWSKYGSAMPAGSSFPPDTRAVWRKRQIKVSLPKVSIQED